MKIIVNEVIKSDRVGCMHVRFSCLAGKALATWHPRSRTLPMYDQSYSTELDIEYELDRDSFVSAMPNEKRLQERDGKTVIVGQLESVDSDNMTYVRLSSDCLVMVQSSVTCEPGDWVRIDCDPHQLFVFPIG